MRYDHNNDVFIVTALELEDIKRREWREGKRANWIGTIIGEQFKIFDLGKWIVKIERKS